jgi:hypothetical protein
MTQRTIKSAEPSWIRVLYLEVDERDFMNFASKTKVTNSQTVAYRLSSSIRKIGFSARFRTSSGIST